MTDEIIGYHINNKGIIRSDGVAQFQKPFLDFLLEKQGMKLFSDLDYCTAKLIKHIGLPEEAAKYLNEEKELKKVPPTYITESDL